MIHRKEWLICRNCNGNDARIQGVIDHAAGCSSAAPAPSPQSAESQSDAERIARLHQIANTFGVQTPPRIAMTDAAARIEAQAAEIERLRKLMLRWLQITNVAKKSGATVADWDKLRQETNAAIAAKEQSTPKESEHD